MTKAQAVVLQNEPSNLQDKIICKAHNTAFERSVSSFQHNPKTIFNFSTHAEEAQVINRLYASKHITLKNKAKWALGIVTGNNDRFCSKTPKTGYVPIYKGSDITKSGLKEPNTFILNDFSNFQQVASLDMYHAQEKLIYKFISSDLCFFCDTEQRYMLNSANMLIPTGIGISGAQLTQLLNSDIINWLFKKLFATHKILRGDLELLPIHSDYFLHHQEFSASSYLDYLYITKTEHGTFSIKK
jgi:site-specific DNA-methyltransferase (adenine-specific)